MDLITQLAEIFSSISGLGFLIGIIVLWQTGLLDYLIKLHKNGKNGNRKNFSEFEGYAKAKLESLCERVDEIKETLDNHVRDEDKKSERFGERLAAIEAILKK